MPLSVAVPTLSMAQTSHNRLFERALSMAGAAHDSFNATPDNQSQSDDSSLQSFSDVGDYDETGLGDMTQQGSEIDDERRASEGHVRDDIVMM